MVDDGFAIRQQFWGLQLHHSDQEDEIKFVMTYKVAGGYIQWVIKQFKDLVKLGFNELS